MINNIIYYIATYIIWLFLTWPFNPLNLQDIVAGLVVAFVGVIVFSPRIQKKYSKKSPASKFKVEKLLWAILYVPILIYYMIVANFDVLYRIIKTERLIKPGIVKVNTKLKNPLARTILCNSITLTPGTLTVDIKEEVIYVHWVNITTSSPQKATQKIAGRFEKILKKVFE